MRRHASVFSSVLKKVCALLAFGAPAALAQGSATPTDSNAFTALSWRLIGPFRAGRAPAVAGSAARPFEYYAGTTGGGVFKTVNGGATWSPISDKTFGGTIGGIAVSASNPDIIYAGTGEYTLRGNVSPGDGVYKSTDAGVTWTFVGLRDSRQISRVLVHPTNPDIVYVGALGHAFGPNAERGLFRSTDGGKSWKNVLFRSDSAGIADVVMDPSDPRTLYAATFQVVRKPWDIVAGGEGSALFKSTDGGDTWTELTRNPGLPRGVLGNIGIAVSPVKSTLLWAMVQADSGGLYRSDDAGATWRRVNSRWDIRWRPFYFSRVFADPKDTNVVYQPNGTLFKSTDGGKTFKSVRKYDELWDTHELWIDPSNPKRFIVGADAGARVTNDGGTTLSYNEYPSGQFYHVTTTSRFPYDVCGPQQDNSGACGPSRARGIFDLSVWWYPGGGESEWVVPSPVNPDVTYSASAGVTRVNHATGESRTFEAWPEGAGSVPASAMKYRWNWTTPLMVSPHDPRILYTGANVLFKTTDEGLTWKKISGDLTRADPRTLRMPGGPITPEGSGAETYGTIFALAESPVARGVIWTGSDDGLVHVTRDSGTTWSKVSPPTLGEWARISMIEASHYAAGGAYVAANRYQLEDDQPYIFKTSDYGKTWTRITTGIPADEYVRVVREDPVRKGLLFAGTERGVWVSFDDGAQWQPLRRNLPIVPVHDLVVKDADLVIATHGRAFWIMDDISPLREVNAGITAALAHLFTPAKAYRVSWSASPLMEGHPVGANPANGAWIYYWLKETHHDIALEILDPSGRVVRSYSSRTDSATLADSVLLEPRRLVRNDSLKRAGVTDTAKFNAPAEFEPGEPRPFRLAAERRAPDKAGLNVFRWDFASAAGDGLVDTTFETPRTPAVTLAPARYTVRLTVDGDRGAAQSRAFIVMKDPRIASTQLDLESRVAFSTTVRDRIATAIAATKRLRSFKAQAASRAKLDSLSAIERTLVTPAVGDPSWRAGGLIARIYRAMGDPDYAPTRSERAAFAETSAQFERVLATINRLLGAGILPH